MTKEAIAIKNSALWAAYGDALGFITELADTKSLHWRTKAPRVAQTVSWRRVIGGKFGVEATLPAGCYSDDTQLRLATSRAIRGDGKFDVEAFSKVELAVWLSYALGAGRGTKLAAASLKSSDVAWFGNFFDKSRVRYVDCGGNGAAMRIQPHVWAAPSRSKPQSYLLDVIRNAVCTHGHLRGILGAVFHALCLATTLEEGRVAGPDAWMDAINFFPSLLPLMREDPDLGTIWLSVWQERVGRSIETAITEVRDECQADIELAIQFTAERSDASYCRLVEALGGLTDKERGSGTKTAIIAAALSWIHRDDFPATAMVKAANLLGSDTDSIATMAGAILGAVSNEPPRGPVLDEEYLVFEASRMARLSRKENVETFVYPDLFVWHPPKTQLDGVGRINTSLALAGLAKAKELGPPLESRKKEDAVWQWLRLEFGQSVFAKRREIPNALPEGNMPLPCALGSKGLSSKASPAQQEVQRSKYPEQRNLIDRGDSLKHAEKPIANIDQLTADAIKSDFDEQLIGKHLMSLANGLNGIEHAVAYTSIIVKARMARSKSDKNANHTG
ncbi:MAG TPA: ADP-ribosylglycohydrolase [Blastocatellia bacterium]|nr:ADP-ribosylglycohydrolase [Blastocatellia bacterium]